MKIVPLSLKQAKEFLAKHERHYKAPVEPICAIGVGEWEEIDIKKDIGLRAGTPLLHIINGAAVLGRRDGETAELAHIYCDGTSQAYSLLYGACWRALKALGYAKAVL